MKNNCVKTSYTIGLPIGLLVIGVFIFTPIIISGEGLISILLSGIYGKATIGLTIAFIISLYFGGIQIFKELETKQSTLTASFKYSLSINSIIWGTFLLVTLIDNFNDFNFLIIIPPLILFVVCLLFTPFTIGLIVTKYLQKNYFDQNKTNSKNQPLG
jgi:hypothetical protein